MGLEQKENEKKSVARADVLLKNIRMALGGLVGVDDFEMPDVVAQLVAKSAGPNVIRVPVGYESLGRVLKDALDQAAGGKGKARHAVPGVPFEQQSSCRDTREVGLAYPIGQARKKALESLRLDRGHNRAEILGSIVYLGMAGIVMDEPDTV